MKRSMMFILVLVAGLGVTSEVLAGPCFKIPADKVLETSTLSRLPARICVDQVDHIQFGQAVAHVTDVDQRGISQTREVPITYANDPYDNNDYPVQAALLGTVRGDIPNIRADILLDMGYVWNLSTSSLSIKIVDEKNLTENVVNLVPAELPDQNWF